MSSTPAAEEREQPARPTLAECRRQLRSEDVRVRIRATRELANLEPKPEALLLRALVDASPEVRAAAREIAQDASEFETQEALLKLLENPNSDIRDHAARKLGEIGDERALVPLMAAYRRCFSGGAPRKERWLGLVIIVSLGLFAALTLWQWATGKFSASDLVQVGWMAFTVRSGFQTRGESWQAILQAILKVAERSPGPELHRLLPDLQSLATNRLQVHPEARAVARSAAVRIETLTAAIQDLPVPPVAPVLGSGSLPVPAEQTVGRANPAPGSSDRLDR